MILIPCIHCGLRNASEFRYGGEVSSRPDPSATTRSEWSAYLYATTNAADWTKERWFHTAGCRRHFIIERHTVSNEIRAARPPGNDLETV
jgi:heterotetrameric sarcosine oxidase delta subunit